MQIGILGLGRMGSQIARRLHTKGFNVIAWNRSAGPREEIENFFRHINTSSPLSSPPISGERNERRGGIDMTVQTISELIAALSKPRILWLMLPSGELVDDILSSLSLSKDDIVIDGGNSFYKDSRRRSDALAEKGVHFFDCGTSGGVWGEKNGFSLMVGGPKEMWPRVEPVFKALAALSDSHPRPLSISPSPGGEKKGNYGLVGPAGAGHFVKMVHNGIEYGMMEAIGEGFAVLHASEFKFDFAQIAGIWSRGAVVSSWLMELAKNIFETENLDHVAGTIPHTGEGQWTIEAAKQLGVDVRVIEDAFKIRQESADPKNQEKFSNKIVALLRKQFGGHEVKYKA